MRQKPKESQGKINTSTIITRYFLQHTLWLASGRWSGQKISTSIECISEKGKVRTSSSPESSCGEVWCFSLTNSSVFLLRERSPQEHWTRLEKWIHAALRVDCGGNGDAGEISLQERICHLSLRSAVSYQEVFLPELPVGLTNTLSHPPISHPSPPFHMGQICTLT